MLTILNRSIRLIRLLFGLNKLTSISDPQKKLRARKAILQQFTDARGVTMKVGQLIAASADDDVMKPLVTSIEPLPLKKVLPLIESSLGCHWKKVFSSIDESSAAASLGQVHHAVLRSGEEVALKVQYPDIEKAIEAEMNLLGLMPKAGPVKKWHLDLDGYRNALKENMSCELDYRHEAETQKQFYQQLNLPAVIVPRIFDVYSSEKLLLQSWEDGVFLDQTINWPKKDRIRIAKILLSLLLTSLFQTRHLHADPHMGNSVFRYNDVAPDHIEMVLMDFGCSIELDEQQSLALLKLILSVHEKTSGLPINNFSAMGFDAEKLSKIEAYLPRLCLYLFEPFIDDNVFQLRNWRPGEKITALLAEQRWWFRSAGPARLIFIMRAFQGFVQQLQLLNVDINWWQVLQETLPASLLQQARDYECPAARSYSKLDFTPLASTLKVKVTKQGETKAEVTLPAEAVLDLEKFIPEEIQLKLSRQEDINLQQIVERVRESSIAAQTVFDYQDETKHYQVWLE